MTPEETVAYVRDFAARQEAFADPDVYPHLDAAERRQFRHAAAILRDVANRLEVKYRTASETQPKGG